MNVRQIIKRLLDFPGDTEVFFCFVKSKGSETLRLDDIIYDNHIDECDFVLYELADDTLKDNVSVEDARK